MIKRTRTNPDDILEERGQTMATIDSVLGPMDTADLGFTLSHEHVLESSAGIQHVYPEFIDREGTITKAIGIFKNAHAEGVRTIVDVTTIDLGRDVGVLEQVSRESGVQIICATGVWLDIPRAFWAATPDEIAPLFIREIRDGIEGTGIKAGVIKVANDQDGVTPEGEIVLRAAARAQVATGVPISTHTWAPNKTGEEQIRIFEDEGVDLHRVYIGHSDNTDDTDYLKGMAEKGAFIGLDGLHAAGFRPGTPDLQHRIETAKELIDAGFAHRMMLGHDWSVLSDMFGGKEARAELEKINPDGYLVISRMVLPRLREMGVSERTINQIMVDNPRRLFEGS